MTKMFRSQVVLAATIAVAGAVGFAQSSGEATYKAKCAMCHGATGTPSPSMAKTMGVKPTSDPESKKLSVDQIVAVVRSGKGKMKPVPGLSDAQAKDASTFFHSLK